MSFKRPRPLTYGSQKGQVITRNGISEPSPLDKKEKPLEQQNKFLFVISSDNRNQAVGDSKGEDVESTDCVISFKTKLRGIYGYRVLSFTFTNRFFSVQTGLNDILKVDWGAHEPSGGDITAAVIAGNIVLNQGYYEFSSEPSDWVNDPLVSPYNLNDVKYSDIATLLAGWTTDVRVQLLSAAKGAITEITTNRLTDQLTLTWNAAQSLAPTLNRGATKAMSVLGLSRNSSGAVWVGLGPPNVDGPTNMALSSTILNNSQLLGPTGENDWFMTVPVSVPEGSRQTYTPFFPTFVNLNTQIDLGQLPIKIVEPESGQVLDANNMEWQLEIEFYSLNPNPFY